MRLLCFVSINVILIVIVLLVIVREIVWVGLRYSIFIVRYLLFYFIDYFRVLKEIMKVKALNLLVTVSLILVDRYFSYVRECLAV